MDFLGLKSVWMERKENKKRGKLSVPRIEEAKCGIGREESAWNLRARECGGEQVVRDLETSESLGPYPLQSENQTLCF